jgi:hypothetical protein
VSISEIWTTREGSRIAIRDMASSHLLSTIHYIERNRFMNSVEVQMRDRTAHTDELTNLYLQWPPQYDFLIAEAQRRGLIQRGIEGLVKRTRKNNQ